MDPYADFNMLSWETEDDIFFIGGKDYLPLFCKLTAGVRGKRTVFYNSANTPPVQGCKLMHFHTTTRTNWHYECATAMLESAICI
jgi:hypothetical protein